MGQQTWLRVSRGFLSIPHLVTETLHRGDYAQMFAIALLPAILLCYHRLVRRGGLAYFVASVVSLAALVLTHNVTTMLFGPFLLAYVGFLMVNGRRLQRVPLATAAIALAFLITAFFWLPALCERQHVRTENLLQGDFDFRNHFLSWSSLLSPPAIDDIRRANPERVYSLGPAHVSLAILGLLSACTARGRLKNRSRLVALYLAMTGGAVLLMLPLSQPVWEMLPLLALAQFPWRFLSIAGLGLSLIAGGAVALVSDRGPLSPARLATIGSVSIIGKLAKAYRTTIVSSSTFTRQVVIGDSCSRTTSIRVASRPGSGHLTSTSPTTTPFQFLRGRLLVSTILWSASIAAMANACR